MPEIGIGERVPEGDFLYAGWEVKLMPQDLEGSISYRLPEAIMNGLVW
jgi:hypothetical protein